MSDERAPDARAVSSSDRVVLYVRDAIAHGELWPNQRLIESDLAARVGVSRTPVREAIRELARLGLVQSVRNKGAFVVPVDSNELREIYAVRSVLEVYAAHMAMPNMTESLLQSLTELNVAMAASVRGGDVETFVTRNQEFHFEIYSRADNRLLLEMIRNLSERCAPFRRAVWGSQRVAEISIAEHDAIIGAMRARDSALVESLVHNHIKLTSPLTAHVPHIG